MSGRRQRSGSRHDRPTDHGDPSTDHGVDALFGAPADDHPADFPADDYPADGYLSDGDPADFPADDYPADYPAADYPADDYGDAPLAGERREPSRHAATDTVARPRRADRHRQQRNRRRRSRRRLVALFAFLLVAALAVGGFAAVRTVTDRFRAQDYSGSGTGSVQIQIRAGDGTAAIGDTLVGKQVVASRRAFVDAARKSGRSDEFQPGVFALRRHMSSASAVEALLNPSTRLSERVTVTEGAITLTIAQKLATALKVPLSSVQAAMRDVSNLGITAAYGTPKSAEGFLFPATYDFDPGTTPAQALQQMVGAYLNIDRDSSFSSPTTATGRISPYGKLIVASIVESEARFDGDRGKVAQVMYNRLRLRMPLGSDATSAYGAKLAGQDPTKVDYSKAAPYNTRSTTGLPPTPIGNPGQASLTAAAEPTAGNWLYFVSSDAEGHLFFTNSPTAFEAAAEKCRKNKWGCT